MLLRRLGVLGAFAALVLAHPGQARAELEIRVDKSAQRMTVLVDGAEQHSWTVSTGRNGFGTPNGSYKPQWLAKSWFSRQYYNSPMPHSIFFHQGYAIHGSHAISQLGGPASHGCVRLHPANAATLYALVRREGMANTRILIEGTTRTQIAKERPSRRRALAAAAEGREGARRRAAYRETMEDMPDRRARHEQPRFRYRGRAAPDWVYARYGLPPRGYDYAVPRDALPGYGGLGGPLRGGYYMDY